MINAVVLMGRLVRDPEIRTTTSGKSVCSFSLAVERDFQRSEEKTADYFDCVAWGNTAEFVGKYFHKGRMIALQGRLQARTYKDREGNNRKVVEVIADKVSFTGEPKKAESAAEREPPGWPAFAECVPTITPFLTSFAICFNLRLSIQPPSHPRNQSPNTAR